MCSDDHGSEGNPQSYSELLDVKDIVIGGNETQGSMSVKANCAWNITEDIEWLSVRPSSGEGDAAVYLTVSENPSSMQERTGILVVKSKGGITRNVQVKQTAASDRLSISSLKVTFASDASEQELDVTANSAWRIVGQADWLTVSPSEGEGNAQTVSIKLQAQANPSEEDRTSVLVITSAGGSREEISVVQQGIITTLSASPSNIQATATASTYQIQVEGTATWRATSNQDWAQLDVITGQGEKLLQLSCSDNTSMTQRQAIITIASLKHTANITVTQAAGSAPVLASPQVSNITKTGATVSSSFTSLFPVSEYGICYATAPEPTVSNYKVAIKDDAIKEKSFSITLADYQQQLSENTTYYVRAYAISAVGTVYSETISFTTQNGVPENDDVPSPTLIKKQ